MRVLMTADSVGGVWTYAMELTRALPSTEFVIATMGALPTPAQCEEVPPNARLVTSEYRLEWMDEPWEDVARAGDWLLELEAREAPDVVHLNGYAHGALPFRAPKLVVGHSCVRTWWRAVKGCDAPSSVYREKVSEGLRGCDVVVAPTAWMLGALEEEYRFETKRKLIYNGRRGVILSRGDGEGSVPSGAAQDRYGSFAVSAAQDDRCTVFTAGRLWDEAKNIRAVIDAAPRIRWPVRIAGDGAVSARNVEHLGRLDAAGMQRAFDAAGIYLFPALYEPFGLSILEAALAGCALVIGDIPSLRELWRDAALFVDPTDPEEIARAVNDLIEDGDRRAFLAERARIRAAEYTPERMAEGYAQVYGSGR
ncbi:MAG TPA: glycosyltransferase family 4 protein [Thermoanaerobaculia bacterium]|nr:glycosyltransferase family 4 protein [Thermoanaerobaculia bacterium]